ncbi:transcription factor Sp3 isoform X2 [Lutzomyia longipalpis]|uniref:transcription factor Sp3 isoform X2 n=1 Tax=Lutzomyia longipalpis TaxID=7200 RepID=UPI002483DD24|nr:transcription factor Sp3 isoform X2 [Lutzomyia longipalpis]
MAKMSEYRCVNYYELCRLCTGSHGTKVHIFSEDGKKRNLFNKITGCLPIQLSEKDKLPKIVCGQCLQQVESIMEFRETCVNAQTMLESCLNSSKLRNEGKVYIKDVVAKRNVLPTATPSLVTVRPVTVANSVKTVSTIPASGVTQITQNSDFLSSIIQAVGIPSVEEGAMETQTQTQITPQYTLTLDGQTIKANPIQYKIKEEHTVPIVEQQQQSAFAQVDEFLKLKTTTQIGSTQITRRTVKAAVKPPEPPKAKKPKINLVLATPASQQQQPKVMTSPTIATAPMTVSTSPTKTVSLQDLKIFSPTNKCFLPITLKDGNSDQQILTQIDTKNIVLPTAFLQMKLQPQLTTVDGQPVVQLTPTAIPTSLSLSTPTTAQLQPTQTSTVNSSLAEAVQNAEIIFTTSSAQFQQQTQQQIQPVSQASTVRLTPLTSSTPIVTTVAHKAPPPATITIQTSPVKQQPAKLVQQPVQQQQIQQQQQPQPRKVTITKKVTQTAPIVKTEAIAKPAPAVVVTTVAAPTTTATTTTTIRTANIPPNCTTCDVCGKTFKRKEHLIQHLKLHAGLRPFKCEEVGCSKTFSRKEHLMRHVVSHTGKKMFSCEFCHKFFSRKDNLNKHKRTHSEYVNNGPFYCEICQKSFVVKMYYVQHKAMHEKEGTVALSGDDSGKKEGGDDAAANGAGGEQGGTAGHDEGTEHILPDADACEEPTVEDSLVVSTPSSQAQIMQVHFTPVTSAQNQGGAAMGSHDTTVLTLPSNISNFVTLNSTQFVASQDVMGHFKIENN